MIAQIIAGYTQAVLFEATQAFLNEGGIIEGDQLVARPGLSTYESSSSSDKDGFFQSKSRFEESRTHSFLPSGFYFPDGQLLLNVKKVDITGTTLKGHHLVDLSEQFRAAMEIATNIHNSYQDHGRFLGFATQEIRRGRQIGAPSIFDLDIWETPNAHKGSGHTLNLEGVQGRIGTLTTEKDVSFKAAVLKQWEHRYGKSWGFSAPTLEGDISDPLVSSIQGLNAADHDADKAAASIRLANEGVKTALLVTRLAMGDPTAWVELALRYLNMDVSWTWSQSRSSFEARQDIPTDLVFNELTLDNEKTFVQGFIKAKNLTIRTKSFKTAPLVNESKLRQSQHSGSWTPGSHSVSSSSSSSSRDETIHVPSQITADHLILECDDGVISGTQIWARIVDALVKNTLTIESVLNVLNEKRNGIDISTNWDIRLEDHHHVREKIDEMASLIGVEEFYLKVGGLLLTRSALIGSPDGIEVIDAAERRHEIIQERDEKSGFVINAPIGTAME